MSEESTLVRSLVARGVLEASLAAHITILLDAGETLTVAAEDPARSANVADAFAYAACIGRRGGDRAEVMISSDHHFEWLSDPRSLGCVDTLAGSEPRGARTMLLRIRGLLRDLDPQVARIALRSLARGHQAVIEAQATDLAALFDALRSAPVRLPEDDLHQLGVVLQVEDQRVTAAHLLHPAAGVARRTPTLLTTWDRGAGRWDDFSWAALPMFAERCGITQAQYTAQHRARMSILGVTSSD